MCKAIRCDSSSELPGIHLGTSWTVRSAMLMYKEERKSAKSKSKFYSTIAIAIA